MSKNTTTPEFEVGDEVLIFADRLGFYSAEESDTPSLREVTIEAAPDEDGDYRIRHSALGWRYARGERVFPLGTILVDGKPVRPEDQDVNRELPEGHSLHSDGGVFFGGGHFIVNDTIDVSKIYVAEPGTPLPLGAEDLGNPASEWTSIGHTDADAIFDVKVEEISDPYQEFLNEVASTLDNRGVDYGGVEDNFADIAAMWSAIAGVEIRADQVGLMMIALKLVRANKTNKRDNLLDIAGYAAHVAKIQEDQLGKA